MRRALIPSERIPGSIKKQRNNLSIIGGKLEERKNEKGIQVDQDCKT
jgi:hypothetical protein